LKRFGPYKANYNTDFGADMRNIFGKGHSLFAIQGPKKAGAMQAYDCKLDLAAIKFHIPEVSRDFAGI